MNYLNARYYDGVKGQFVSQDPLFWNFDQAWLADPQNQNSQAYARNNPINLSDPSGQSFKEFAQYGTGFINSIVTNTALGLGRYNQDSTAYGIGQSLGDAASLGIGMIEMTAGSTIMAGGGALCATGFGSIGGVPALAAGAILTGHGAVNALTASKNIANDIYKFSENQGSGQKNSKNWIEPTNKPQTPNIPENWVSEPAKGRGLIYREPGTTGEQNTIRVMEPIEKYPNGYWRQAGSSLDAKGRAQYIDPSTGKVGVGTVAEKNSQTHIPLPK